MRRLQWVVWNRSERRLRAPWRLLAGTLLFLLLSIATVLALQLFRVTVGVDLLAAVGPTVRPLALNAIGGFVVLLTLVAIAWTLDQRRLSDYGLRIDREWWVDCGFGLALGAAAMTVLVGVGVAGGWLAVSSTGASADLLPQLAGLAGIFLLVGIYEELLVRGYLLTNIAEGLQWFDRLSARAAAVIAALLSALVFGGLHATNPNATLARTV